MWLDRTRVSSSHIRGGMSRPGPCQEGTKDSGSLPLAHQSSSWVLCSWAEGLTRGERTDPIPSCFRLRLVSGPVNLGQQEQRPALACFPGPSPGPLCGAPTRAGAGTVLPLRPVCLHLSRKEIAAPVAAREAATSQTQNHQPCQLGNVLQVVGARGPRGRQGGLSPSPEPGSSLRPVRSCSSTSCQLRDPGDLKFPGWVGSCLPLQHVWAPRPHRRGRQRGSVYSSGQREAAAGCLRGVQQKRSFPGALGCHLLENRCHNSINLASIRMGTAPPRNVRVLPPGAGDVALAEPRGRAEDIKVSDSLHSIPDPEKLLIGGDADELSRRGAGNTLWRPGWLFR